MDSKSNNMYLTICQMYRINSDNSSFIDKALFSEQLSKKISLLDKQLQLLLHGDNYNAIKMYFPIINTN